MAIFGNFKGTTQSEFKIGKTASGNKIFTGELPSGNNSENGDLYIDSSAGTLQVYASNAWSSIGSTLTALNVDNGTLIVNSANDTVSIGSISSNEKLFVNGNLRLGTNPSLQYSGAYLDMRHSNGGTSVVRVRDNSSGTDPVFKVYDANNANEVFKVQGNTTTFSGEATLTGIDTLRINENGTGLRMTGVGAFDNIDGDFRIFSTGNLILSTNGDSGTAVTFDETTKDAVFRGNVTVNNAYALPTSDGSAGQAIVTDGSGNLTFSSIADPVEDYGVITEAANITADYGAVAENDTRTPTSHDSYTVAEANALTWINPGDMIFVSDEIDGATMAFYDGSTWRRIQDRQVIG